MTLMINKSTLGALSGIALLAGVLAGCNKEITDFDRCGCEYGEVCQVLPYTEGVDLVRQFESYGTCIPFPGACDGQLVDGDMIPSCIESLCPENTALTLLEGEKPIALCESI